ncbi:hypothetical protein COL70_09240, partial [Bacillus pseudomycoides]
PSWIVKTFTVLACQPARSPSRIEGVGSWIDGVKGKSSPCRFGQSPRSFCHAMHGSAEPKSVADPYRF